MNIIILGNILALCAMITDSISTTRKKHTEILGIQIISQFFYGTMSVVLKGYSATAQNAVAVFRNLAAMKNIKSKALENILILAGVVLGLVLNNRGLMGLLPVIANFQYSVAVFSLKNRPRALKISFGLNSVLFCIFNFVIMNYVGVVANAVVAISSFIAAARGGAETAKESEHEEADQ